MGIETNSEHVSATKKVFGQTHQNHMVDGQ